MKFGLRTTLAVLAIMVVALLLQGCGGSGTLAKGGGGGVGTVYSGPATGLLLLQFGDNPKSSNGPVETFDIGVTSVALYNSTTDMSVELLNNGRVEVIHNSSTMAPMTLSGVDQGQYDYLIIQFSEGVVTTLDASGNPVMQRFTPPSSQTIDLSKSPTGLVNIGADPTILNINLDVAASLIQPQIGGIRTAGRRSAVNGQSPITLTSVVMTVSQVGIQPTNQTPETGLIGRVVGTVTDVTDQAITVQVGGDGQSLTFQTSSDPTVTVFENVSLATALNMMVEITGAAQADGTLMASEVEGLSSDNGSEVEGMFSGYNPSGTMYLVMQDGTGSGVTSDLVGQKITLSGNPSYEVHSGSLDLSGLPLTFDAQHLFPGQQIEVDSSSALSVPDPDQNAGLIMGHAVELEQQTISGTVVNYTVGAGNTATFDLVLPNDGSSYLRLLNPAAAPIHVYQLSNTNLLNVSGGIKEGQVVQVRGLLFANDTNQGHQPGVNFAMAASRITSTK